MTAERRLLGLQRLRRQGRETGRIGPVGGDPHDVVDHSCREIFDLLGELDLHEGH
ncbi:hypothetical protein SDC9_82457 [bioreactor metagenome]|uniref:Uncharacterized protein n=1 Tax=bioreactor metagenome TaxID=1076179 RepID=A0A644ZAX3_9ZZZZ